MCACECVCVWALGVGGYSGGALIGMSDLHVVCVCVCMCVREGEKEMGGLSQQQLSE